jgi:hypothetical protein
MAATGAIVAGAYALMGTILSKWLPEPGPELDEDEGHPNPATGAAAHAAGATR